MKLFVFDRTTKRIKMTHFKWEESYTLEDNLKSYDSENELALVVEDFTPEINLDGQYIQPKTWTNPKGFKYVDQSELPSDQVN